MSGTVIADHRSWYLEHGASRLLKPVRMIIYSLALILVMIFRPGGLLGTKEFSLKNYSQTRRLTNGTS